MKKAAFAVWVMVALACAASVQARAAYDWEWPDFKVDGIGHFQHPQSGHFQVLVVEIIDKETMLCHLGRAGVNPPFLVTKYPTKGLVDERRIELKGDWKCTGTKKVNGKTRYVVEPVPAKAKAKDKK